jgi:hypothetical protein
MCAPASICTIADAEQIHELYAMLLTLSIHHLNAYIICAVDPAVKQTLSTFTPQPRLTIEWIDKTVYTTTNSVIAYALDKCENTLYIHPRMIICNSIEIDNTTGHTAYTTTTDHLLWVKNTHADGANPIEFDPTYDVRPGDLRPEFKCVYLDVNQHPDFLGFVLQQLHSGKRYKELACIHRIINKGWKMLIPKQPQSGIWTHTNDSFRELAILLQAKHRSDLIVEHSPHVRNLYVEPTVLLYDRDTLQWFDQDAQQAHLVYLGNNDIATDGALLASHGLNVRPWIYWARRPMILEMLIARGLGSKGYRDRPIMSMFLGNIENAVQARHRTTQAWGDYVEQYVCTRGSTHAFTPKEYLEKLGEARFGLSLRGYGSKCHREIELMSVGTVPILTPGVTISSYPVPPQKDIHYLYVERAEEIPALCASISEERWQEMSNACKAWYMEHCHSSNVWTWLINDIIYWSG